MQGKHGGGGHSVARGSALEVMEAVTPVMAATAALMSLLAEPLRDTVAHSVYFADAHNLGITLSIIFIGAIFAFSMVLVEFVLISRTSALTFMVAGVFKEVLTVLVAHVTYGDTFTALSAAGMAVLLVGVGMFNYHQHRKRADAPASPGKAAELPGRSADDAQMLLAHDSEVLPPSHSDGMIELSGGWAHSSLEDEQ
jgi:hypothetical protein